VAAVLAVCCVCCGPYRLLCGGGVPCGGKHIIIKLALAHWSSTRRTVGWVRCSTCMRVAPTPTRWGGLVTRHEGKGGDADMRTPTGYPPPSTQQPTWPTAYTAHIQHCGHTALPPPRAEDKAPQTPRRWGGLVVKHKRRGGG